MCDQGVACWLRFTKSIIKSRAALTYAEAQTLIDDERLTDDISVGLRRLNQVARILRKRRADRGALSLASPEVKFEIDTETHDPTDVGIYQVNMPAIFLPHVDDPQLQTHSPCANRHRLLFWHAESAFFGGRSARQIRWWRR